MVFGPGAHYKCFFIKSNIHKKFNSENTIRPTKVSKPGTEPDQDQEKFPNLGPDQDQQNFENLGPIRTGRSPDQAIRGSLITTSIDYLYAGEISMEKYKKYQWMSMTSMGAIDIKFFDSI